MQDILSRLTEGDMRTTGDADAVAKEIAGDPQLFDAVFAGLFSNDAGLRMRCADALEKATKNQPGLLAPYKKELLERVTAIDQQEVQWHAAFMLPRLQLTPAERQTVLKIMEKFYAEPKSRLVRTAALQGIAELALQDDKLKRVADEYIAKSLDDPAPSVRARARHLAIDLRS